MTATAALMRHAAKPPINVMARAIQTDAEAIASEWSRGDDLSMISAKSVARENAPRILLLAAASALKGVDDNMAALIAAYLQGRTAEMQFAWRDHRTASELDEGADGMEGAAEMIVARFREASEELAA